MKPRFEKLTELQKEARARIAELEQKREEIGSVEHPAIEGRQREADYLREVAQRQGSRIEAIKL